MYSFDYTNYNIFKIILKQDYFCINLGQVEVKGLQKYLIMVNPLTFYLQVPHSEEDRYGVEQLFAEAYRLICYKLITTLCNDIFLLIVFSCTYSVLVVSSRFLK